MTSSLRPEIWAPINGCEGYSISSHGRVSAAAKRIVCGKNGGYRNLADRLISPFVCKQTGYLQVTFADRKKRNVHRLAAEAFLTCGLPDQVQVNHIDGVRSNPCIENLEWVTASENVEHGFRANGRVNPFQGRTSGAHSTSKAVIATCLETGAITRYPCASDAVRIGFSSGSISRCCTGKSISHRGFTWKFSPKTA